MLARWLVVHVAQSWCTERVQIGRKRNCAAGVVGADHKRTPRGELGRHFTAARRRGSAVDGRCERLVGSDDDRNRLSMQDNVYDETRIKP